MSFAPSGMPGRIYRSTGNYRPYPLLPQALGRLPSSGGATGPYRSQDRPRLCLLHVCSDVPVRPGSGRYEAAPGLAVCRTARQVL